MPIFVKSRQRGREGARYQTIDFYLNKAKKSIIFVLNFKILIMIWMIIFAKLRIYFEFEGSRMGR